VHQEESLIAKEQALKNKQGAVKEKV